MPSRPQLVARLRGSYRYEEVAEEFGIPPGLAYMIVTGLPADGSDVLTPEEIERREGIIDGPTQALVNPPTEMPKHKSSVEDWMKSPHAYLAARSKARTRPHPHTPPLPAVLGSVGMLVAGMDRARDALTGRKVPTP